MIMIYISFVTFLSDYFTIYDKPIGGVPGAFLPGSLEDGMTYLAERAGIDIKVKWGKYPKDKAIDMMKEMFLENTPVVFSYDNTLDINKDRLILYTWSGGEYISDNGQGKLRTIGSHYMTATGIIEYSDEVARLLKHKYMLRISSWGQKFYVDYNDILEKLSIGTNFLYITK